MHSGFLFRLCLPALCWLGWLGAALAALPTPDADDGGLVLPPGFHALVVADNLGKLRFMSVAPNGDIYLKKSDAGLVALRDTKGTGRTDVVEVFGAELGGGTGVCVHDGYLYFSTNDAVYRYALKPGELVPQGAPEAIVTGLPPGQKEHEAKAFTFDDQGNLYVEIGCPSNSSGDPDRALGAKGVDPADLFVQHGGFWRFKENVPNQDQLKDGFHFSSGMRHDLSIAWQPVSKALFITMMGRDQLNTVDPDHYTAEDNAELPAEEMHLLKQGSVFGWPYTYWDPLKKARMVSPEFGGDNRKRDDSGKYPDPLIAFPAHWAPMQMTFYTGTQFPDKYRNGAFIAFHGSWNRAPLPQAGYRVAFVPFDGQGMPTGTYETFADNFAGVPVINAPRDAHYRPCGIAVGPDGSLYVSDSEKGRVWRIVYTGEGNAAGAIADTAAPAAGSQPSIYARNCAACHMADGSGVPNMQPALDGDTVVAGDPLQLIRVILLGPANVLPPDRPKYGNTMPPFKQLSDGDIASLLTDLRRQYGKGASPITPDQVAAVRAEKSVGTP